MNSVTYTIVYSPTNQKKEMSFSKIDSIGKVLNTACRAFKVKPENHELRYASRKLELNMNLMFSDLPDDVSLELCPITETDEKVDTVAVNLIVGDGTVNSGRFRKNATLWDVSQGLIPKDKFLEEDRICMSFLCKRFDGPTVLKKVPLSSLKIDEGPLNLSLTRKYSTEKLNVENDKSYLTNKTFHVSTNPGSSSRQDTNKAGTSNARILGNTIRLTDNRRESTVTGNKLTTKFRAKAEIDKHFYLTSEKKLKDLKYLNSRQGIAYVHKPPVGEILREESAVDLLDLGRDSSRSAGGNVELKLFLPDETAIQAIFRVDETVGDVLEFLNPLLQCQPSDYFLYASNPTESVEKNISLNELEDSSGVNLYLSLNPKVKKVWPKCKPYLKKEYMPKKD